MTVASPRGTRLRWTVNSPHRRWSGVKATPAVAWTLSLGAIRCGRDSASQVLPWSIAAQAPPANATLPRAEVGPANPIRAIATKLLTNIPGAAPNLARRSNCRHSALRRALQVDHSPDGRFWSG